jgi:hypothetical protein
MSDEQMIRQTVCLYAQRHDDRDAIGFVSLFAEAGRSSSASGEHVGRPQVKLFIEDLYARQPADRRTKHLFGNLVISIRGDEADCASDVAVWERFGAQPWRLLEINRHMDRLVRDGNAWLFLKNHVETR